MIRGKGVSRKTLLHIMESLETLALGDTQNIIVSLVNLSSATKISERHLQSCLRYLEEQAYISIERHQEPGCRAWNSYAILRQLDLPLHLSPAELLSTAFPKKRKKQARSVIGLRLRFKIFQRDQYRCRLCGRAASDNPAIRLEVDHIVARSQGGTNDESNLWALCSQCNSGKYTNSL